MMQEDKELLLKDLCARLPYKLVCKVKFKEDGEYKTSNMFLDGVFDGEAYFFTKKVGSVYSNAYKPYLFPLSSMTEEQKRELEQIKNNEDAPYYHDINDFFLKHHLDNRHLIEKGLAIDATGQKIY